MVSGGPHDKEKGRMDLRPPLQRGLQHRSVARAGKRRLDWFPAATLLTTRTAFSSRRGSRGGGIGRLKATCLRLELRSHPTEIVSRRLRRTTEGVGFEPTETRASPVFKTGAFNRSATPPGYRRSEGKDNTSQCGCQKNRRSPHARPPPFPKTIPVQPARTAFLDGQIL